MKQQGLAYCAAMKVAMDDLDRICQESERLKDRQSVAEPVNTDQLAPQMVGTAIPQIVAQNLIESTDPIQRRINSVLGLAVA